MVVRRYKKQYFLYFYGEDAKTVLMKYENTKMRVGIKPRPYGCETRMQKTPRKRSF